MARTLRSLLRVCLELQVERPGAVLVAALLSVALALHFSQKLGLRTSFGELLPESKESVRIAEEVQRHLPSISTLMIVAEGSRVEGLKRLAQALKPELEAIEPAFVSSVEIGVHASRKFFEQHQALYAKLETLEEIHDEIRERYDYEVTKRAGMLVVDDAPPELTEQTLRSRLADAAAGSTLSHAEERYPDGYYLDAAEPALVVVLRTPITSGDLARSGRLKELVLEALARVDPPSFDPSVRLGFTGNLVTAAEEYAQIKDDLAHVGVFGVSLILGVVFLFYLRLRTLLAMIATVGIGTIWTFGLAYFLVGHLNSATGFLVSIVVGNGINFGIIFMARYLEERRTACAEASIAAARKATWLPTLTAAGTATAAYGSLAVTDFRGFKHFGAIGGSGMLLCWIATFAFLPSILTLMERVWPLRARAGFLERVRAGYGRPFAYLATHGARVVTLGGCLLTLATGVLAFRYVANDPMEYDMANIRNRPFQQESEAKRLGRRADKIVGGLGQDGIAVMVPRAEQAPLLKRALYARRDLAPADRKPFSDVVTLYDLLPSDQERKLALIESARGLLDRANHEGFLSPADRQKIEGLMPPRGFGPLGLADIPEQVARSFVEKDGTRGRLVYIKATPGRSVWDAHYLIEWADSFRTTTLEDGTVVKGSGQSVIFADMILAVLADAPRAILLSLVTTLAIVLVAFRFRGASFLVVGAVVVGLVWTLGVLAVWKTTLPWNEARGFVVEGLKLNFLNFVALPITIGVGADYAVNIVQRLKQSPNDVGDAIVETGGAVVLCSLTTLLGYSALTLSVNQAIQSFGVAAAAGELCCTLAAVLVLPAAVHWLRKARPDAR